MCLFEAYVLSDSVVVAESVTGSITAVILSEETVAGTAPLLGASTAALDISPGLDVSVGTGVTWSLSGGNF